MYKKDVILLTRKLISFNTVNPPGNELEIAKYVGSLLEENGFDVVYPEYQKKRSHLIAEKGLSSSMPPIVFSGHFDTVPIGAKKWRFDPFGGEVFDKKIFGRGSSDMKAGIAAIICAAIHAFDEGEPEGGIRIILTADEELGCRGAQQLVDTYKNLGLARALIVAEPTANMPVIGHKGALYMKVSTSGVAAHSSMPQLGENAIYKAAHAISKVEKFNFKTKQDPLLGFPTINVGTVSGGMNLNSVPDHAEFTIDVRTTTKLKHSDILLALKNDLGDETKIITMINLPPMSTNENDSFVQLVYDACKLKSLNTEFPKTLPYLTDGSVFQKYYNNVPTVILGPGQPEVAHQIDEFCYLSKLRESVIIYKNIMLNRRN